MWASIIPETIRGVAAFFRWKAATAELEFRTVRLFTEEKIEDEIQKLRSELESLDNAGRYHDSERLRKRISRRAFLSQTLPAGIPGVEGGGSGSDPKGNLYPTSGRSLGKSLDIPGASGRKPRSD